MLNLLNNKGQVIAIQKKDDPTTFRFVGSERTIHIREDMACSFHLCFIEYVEESGKKIQVGMYNILEDGELVDGEYIYKF